MHNGYSVCMNKWSLDKDIKSELGLLLIISSLCAEKGYCYASNEYLASLFNVSEVSISTKIKKLEKKGYITIDYKKRGCEVISREIRLKNILIDDLKNINPTIKENFKENNINIKIINNNKYKYYGTYKRVKLSDKEYQKLIEEFGEEFIIKQIEKLDEYIESNNNKNKYTNFNLVLRKSIREKWFNKNSDIDLPNWFDKDIKTNIPTEEEQKEFQDIINSFN